MPFDPNHEIEIPKSREPDRITWRDELRARLYCGHFGVFMRQGRFSCMSSARENIHLTPIEEERLVRAVHAQTTNPEAWKFDTYTVCHLPTGTEFWMANGRVFFRVYGPKGIALRTRSQRRLYRSLCALRRTAHRARHRTISDEATKLIRQFEHQSPR